MKKGTREMITAAKSGVSPRGWGCRLPPARLGKAEWGGLRRAQAVGEGMGEGVMRDCCLQEAGWLRTRVCRRHRAQQSEDVLITAHEWLRTSPTYSQQAFTKGHPFLVKAVLITFSTSGSLHDGHGFVRHFHIILRPQEERRNMVS